MITLHTVGVISDDELQAGAVPGLERAVRKNKGVEVGSLLHQLGVEVGRNPYGPNARKLMLEIDPKCKDRLPKRQAARAARHRRQSPQPPARQGQSRREGRQEEAGRESSRRQPQPAKKASRRRRRRSPTTRPTKRPTKPGTKTTDQEKSHDHQTHQSENRNRSILRCDTE